MSDKKQLNDLREQIDALDSRLLALISERAQLAKAIAGVKGIQGNDNGYYRPEREAQILRKVIEQNQGPLSEEEMARLFREIMSACLALEQALNIAYLGPEGTFTQTAALKHFGHSVSTSAYASIDQVFDVVVRRVYIGRFPDPAGGFKAVDDLPRVAHDKGVVA